MASQSSTDFVSVPTHRGTGTVYNAQHGNQAEVGGRVEDLARSSNPNQTPTYAGSSANTPIGFSRREPRGEGVSRPLPEIFGQQNVNVDPVPLVSDVHRQQRSAGV